MTIEFGFAITMLVVLALGTFDFGRLGLRKITVSNAARAGAEYGTQDFGTATDVNGIIQAARNDADDNNNSLNIAARQYCSCPTDGEIACTAMCSDGTFNLMYVEVSVQDQVDLVFPYPGVTSPRAIVSTSKMRVR
ncbi:MAG: TadE/TadG family type IV pilus assembly protein [Kiloniellaceae bacterium]